MAEKHRLPIRLFGQEAYSQTLKNTNVCRELRKRDSWSLIGIFTPEGIPYSIKEVVKKKTTSHQVIDRLVARAIEENSYVDIELRP